MGIETDAGEGVEQDLAKAVGWFRRAAEQNHVAAQHLLGLCYAEGEGVPQNRQEALKWLRRSAARGYEPAKESLREME